MNEQLKQRADDAVALAEKATPGPWRSEHHAVVADDGWPICLFSSTRGKYEWEKNNRDFLARAHDHVKIIRELLAEIERWRPVSEQHQEVAEAACIVRIARLEGRLHAFAEAMRECDKNARRGLYVGARDCSEIRTAIDILHLKTLQELRPRVSTEAESGS